MEIVENLQTLENLILTKSEEDRIETSSEMSESELEISSDWRLALYSSTHFEEEDPIRNSFKQQKVVVGQQKDQYESSLLENVKLNQTRRTRFRITHSGQFMPPGVNFINILRAFF